MRTPDETDTRTRLDSGDGIPPPYQSGCERSEPSFGEDDGGRRGRSTNVHQLAARTPSTSPAPSYQSHELIDLEAVAAAAAQAIPCQSLPPRPAAPRRLTKPSPVQLLASRDKTPPAARADQLDSSAEQARTAANDSQAEEGHIDSHNLPPYRPRCSSRLSRFLFSRAAYFFFGLVVAAAFVATTIYFALHSFGDHDWWLQIGSTSRARKMWITLGPVAIFQCAFGGFSASSLTRRLRRRGVPTTRREWEREIDAQRRFMIRQAMINVVLLLTVATLAQVVLGKVQDEQLVWSRRKEAAATAAAGGNANTA